QNDRESRAQWTGKSSGCPQSASLHLTVRRLRNKTRSSSASHACRLARYAAELPDEADIRSRCRSLWRLECEVLRQTHSSVKGGQIRLQIPEISRRCSHQNRGKVLPRNSADVFP